MSKSKQPTPAAEPSQAPSNHSSVLPSVSNSSAQTGSPDEQIERLINRLDLDEKNREETITEILRNGTKNEEWANALLRALRPGRRTRVRRGAAEVLGRLDVKTDEVITGLLHTLQTDDDDWVRKYAAEALGELRVPTEEVLDALTRHLLTGRKVVVRCGAAVALGRLGVSTDEVIAALLHAMLPGQSEALRQEAVLALGKLRVATEEVLAAIVRVLQNDEDHALQLRAAEALGHIGSAAVATAQSLTQLLEQANFGIYCQAAAALLTILPVADAMVRILPVGHKHLGNKQFLSQLSESLEENSDHPLEAKVLANWNEPIQDQEIAQRFVLVQLDKLLKVTEESPPPTSSQRPTPRQHESQLIQTEEITRGRAAVEKRQKAVEQEFQDWLDSLAGRRGKTTEENRQIADEIYDAARCAGIQLICKDQPGYLRFAKGVFEMLATDSSRKWLDSSATFPQLTARAKQSREAKVGTPETVGKWSQDVQASRANKKPRRK